MILFVLVSVYFAVRARTYLAGCALGLAALGTQVGEFIWWAEDGQSHSGRIARVLYQPEAVGAHHL